MEKSIDLYFKEGSSDKEYHVQLVPSGNDTYLVNFQFGRRGSTLKPSTKTKDPVSLMDAESIYNRVVKEKLKEGYIEKEGGSSTGFQPVIKVKETIGVFPQLLNTIEHPNIYIESNDFVAQEKFDGERRMVVSEKGDIYGLNRKGQKVALPSFIANSVHKDLIIDGEIIGDTLYAFDILSLHGEDLRGYKYLERLAILNSDLKLGDGIKVVYTAFTPEEKQELYDKTKSLGKEGVVFKKKKAVYISGRPSKGGDQLKFKFYKTATFIVKNFTAGKRSVGVELIDGNNRVEVGRVTIPPNQSVPNIGELIEVRYLYAYKGGSIYQSVYIGKRNDLDIEAADINQLIYKAPSPDDDI